MKRKTLPMNLQFFAEPAPSNTDPSAGTQTQSVGEGTAPAFDYDKLASIIAGKQTATEDSVLRGYFKNQGLSKEEADQAMAAYKAQKAQNQPDVNAMQTQMASFQAEATRARLESAATMAAVGLGLDAKTIPYVLKLADFSQVMGQDGKINGETLKNALNKVLEDVPALKVQPQTGTGFVQIGAGNGQQTQSAVDAQLDRIFGTTKK